MPTGVAASSAPPGARRSTPLLDELDREWTRLRRRPTTIATLRSWTSSGALHDAAQHATSLDDIMAATQPRVVGREIADNTVCALLDLSDQHPLAGRIVLQRMLSALITTAARWQRSPRDEVPTCELVGAAWISIRNYDTSERRRHVIPALVSDAVWIGLRRDRQRKSATEIPTSTEALAERAAPEHRLEAITALAATLRAATRHGVTHQHIEFIGSLAAAESPLRASLLHRVTPRTIRNRRDAAGASIRSALGPDWADWSDPIINAA